MPDVRITQDIVEVLAPTIVPVRESQNVVEVLSPTIVPVRETQDVIELLSIVIVPVRNTQHIIELIGQGAPDISGVYFINTKKTEAHDSFYNGIEGKIPDPTIRLALIGD